MLDTVKSPMPLLYDLSELVVGRNFAAFVRCPGKALVEPDEDEISILAITPGGFGGCGGSFNSAFDDFKVGLSQTLWDLAKGADSYAEFYEDAMSFFAPAGQKLQDEWQAAALAVRSGEVDPGGLRTTKKYSPRGILILPVQIPDAKSQAILGPQHELELAVEAA